MGLDIGVYAYTPFNEKIFDRKFLKRVAVEIKQVLLDNGLKGDVTVEQSVSASTDEEEEEDDDCVPT